MVWHHDTDYDPAHAHGGRALALLTDGTAHPVEHTPDTEVTGFVAGCACGWRGTAHLRSQTPRLSAQEAEPLLVREWTEHVHQALPELEVHEVLADPAADPVAAAVRNARAAGASWARIGAAAGTSRQAAWERWRHLEPAPDALPGDLPDGAGFDARRMVLSLLTDRADDEVNPRSSTDWNAAFEGYLRMEQRLVDDPAQARGEGYAQGREDALREHTHENENEGGRPVEVTALLHAVERLREQWRQVGPRRRDELWNQIAACTDRLWEASDPDIKEPC